MPLAADGITPQAAVTSQEFKELLKKPNERVSGGVSFAMDAVPVPMLDSEASELNYTNTVRSQGELIVGSGL